MQGVILRGVGGFYYAMDESGTVHTLRAQGKLRRERLKPKVGDRVELTPGDGEEHGWILSICPRRSELTRPPVANIDVICVVVSAAAPEADLALADRLMVNARRAGIAVRLAVNKSDLNPARAEEIVCQYRGAEAGPIAVSAARGDGLDALRAALAGKVHAMAGQSGAGKSTLVNALYGLRVETGGLSRRIERGRNTTRHCELIPVAGGGMALDTPGLIDIRIACSTPLSSRTAIRNLRPTRDGASFNRATTRRSRAAPCARRWRRERSTPSGTRGTPRCWTRRDSVGGNDMIRIAPSLLAADFRNSRARRSSAWRAPGADNLHFDVMDGNFVPNLSFGPAGARGRGAGAAAGGRPP